MSRPRLLQILDELRRNTSRPRLPYVCRWAGNGARIESVPALPAAARALPPQPLRRPTVWVLRIRHAGGQCLAWLHFADSARAARDWAQARWPGCLVTACEPLRGRRPIATFDSGAARRPLTTPAATA